MNKETINAEPVSAFLSTTLLEPSSNHTETRSNVLMSASELIECDSVNKMNDLLMSGECFVASVAFSGTDARDLAAVRYIIARRRGGDL